jgi:hypothetical protein
MITRYIVGGSHTFVWWLGADLATTTMHQCGAWACALGGNAALRVGARTGPPWHLPRRTVEP